jgi:Uri superfamily endonuclease
VKGSYILVLQLPQPLVALQVGRLGSCDFAPGYYLYVGSAFGPGGLEARIGHHRRRSQARPHWHIDYLRAHARLREIWTAAGPTRFECRWCRALREHPGVSLPVRGFGSRDTRCPAHLFYLPRAPRPSMLTSVIVGAVSLEQPLELLIEIHSYDDG